MPLVLTVPNKGGRDVLIILGPDNIERIQEKDPFELKCWELPGEGKIGVIQISYATDAEMTQITQLAKQGKIKESVQMATSGFKYRPDLGDHDLGPERLGTL